MKLHKAFYILITVIILNPYRLSLAQANEYSFEENSGLKETSNSSGFKNTIFNSSDSINTATAQIITTILSFLGVFFLVLTIIAGYQWMTAGGNQEQVKQAQKRLTNAVIGLVIVLAAYAITVLITSVLSSQTLMN
jgi:VIT1/CCC1 family predicted Fe2+/Mn2+ transporter